MHPERVWCDVLILGAGAVGISVGIAYLNANPSSKVVIVDKEDTLGKHASGRNSGVLHAGFYYSPDSLKAKFCHEGNRVLRTLIRRYSIPLRETGKVVVARNDEEDLRLEALFDRGVQNGVDLELLEESKLSQFEPLATTKNRFLWSPTTAVSDPKLVIAALRREFVDLGGQIYLSEKVRLKISGDEIHDSSNKFDARLIVNAAGAQSDRISREIGVGNEYAMLPFMGSYRFTSQKHLPIKRLVYPVPHKINPFLGVHFTITVDGLVKIGPTAIPVGGREQYSLREGWSLKDIVQATKASHAIVKGKTHDLPSILKAEWPKVIRSNLVRESAQLVPSSVSVGDWKLRPPGIRSQLVHLPSGNLEQDFVIRERLNSIHILNAVSPGWTCALPFGTWIVEKYL